MNFYLILAFVKKLKYERDNKIKNVKNLKR